MSEKIRELANWLLEQGIEVAREVLEDKLEEAYNKGKSEAYTEALEVAADDIWHNVTQKIKREKKELYEKNFYQMPSEEAVIQMRAYEYLEENLANIIKQYKED